MQIIKENLKDIKQLKRRNLLDRLKLDNKRINGIVNSIKEIRKFKNPIGKILYQWTGKNKLNIKKISTSIGVEGIPEWDQVIEVSADAEEFAK